MKLEEYIEDKTMYSQRASGCVPTQILHRRIRQLFFLNSFRRRSNVYGATEGKDLGTSYSDI
jgi:hypothetical protein